MTERPPQVEIALEVLDPASLPEQPSVLRPSLNLYVTQRQRMRTDEVVELMRKDISDFLLDTAIARSPG
jgi:hypothetical protein